VLNTPRLNWVTSTDWREGSGRRCDVAVCWGVVWFGVRWLRLRWGLWGLVCTRVPHRKYSRRAVRPYPVCVEPWSGAAADLAALEWRCWKGSAPGFNAQAGQLIGARGGCPWFAVGSRTVQ
jgi:hypothetical protein